MKNLITDEMIIEFNDAMRIQGSSIILVKQEDWSNSIDIKLPEDKFIRHLSIGLTDEFYELLKAFFRHTWGIKELSFNNTGTTFWSFGE